MNFLVAFSLALVSMVVCSPSGPQNNHIDEDEGDHVDTDENELYDNYNDYAGDHEDMQDGMDEDEGEYVKLPDWMDADLNMLSFDKISLLSSATSLTEMMTMLGLNEEQQDNLDKDIESQLENEGPLELGGRIDGSDEGNDIVPNAEPAGCKPELEVVELESPPKFTYLPQCVRLPRCGGCCTGKLLSCQPTRTKSIRLKVMKLKNRYRTRRSPKSRRARRKARGARTKFDIVEQVSHLDCSCQCRIKEHHCDSSIQEYKESECACVCKNREEEAECATNNLHYWNSTNCSCKCKKTLECSTGEEFNQNTCRCAPITVDGRISNSDRNVCDSFCVNGEPVKCSCKEGWRGLRCIKPICAPGCVHGSCVSPNTCECQEGWSGDQCQQQERPMSHVVQAYTQQPTREGCNCIPINKCEPLLTLAKNRTEENMNILKEAMCDKRHNPPKMCCPSLPPTSSPTSLLPSNCGQSDMDNDRIFGGTEVTMGKYPWIALLGYTESESSDKVHYLCGGSVINDRYVLTAAHCVVDLGSRVLSTVLLGEWDLSTDIDCDENDICLPDPLHYKTEKVIVHSKWNTRGYFSDDIALIRLNTSVNIDGGNFIRAVCLPEAFMNVSQVLQTYKRNKVEKKLTVAGWGKTENGTLSDKLLEVELPLVKTSKCDDIYSGKIVSGQICAGGRNGQDSCQGDSGGPLVLSGPNVTDPYVQVGLVSFGPKRCGRQNFPGVYTELSKYREWIEENLEP